MASHLQHSGAMRYPALAAFCALLACTASANVEESSTSQPEDKNNTYELWRAALELQRNERILSQKELEAALAPHVPAIRACYQRHANHRNGPNGQLILELLIHPEGKIHWIWARARGVRGKELNECIRELSASWVFPKRPGFTNAVIPLSFGKDRRDRRPITRLLEFPLTAP